MTFKSKVKKLSLDKLRQIEARYYEAIDSRRGSGDHWPQSLKLLTQLQYNEK